MPFNNSWLQKSTKQITLSGGEGFFIIGAEGKVPFFRVGMVITRSENAFLRDLTHQSAKWFDV
jgi:hypothetical protein